MKMRERDNSNISIEKQIRRYRIVIKFTIIFGIIWCPVWIIAGILFLIVDFPWQLSGGIFICAISTGFGGGMQIYAYKCKINELEKVGTGEEDGGIDHNKKD